MKFSWGIVIEAAKILLDMLTYKMMKVLMGKKCRGSIIPVERDKIKHTELHQMGNEDISNALYPFCSSLIRSALFPRRKEK